MYETSVVCQGLLALALVQGLALAPALTPTPSPKLALAPAKGSGIKQTTFYSNLLSLRGFSELYLI